MFETQSGTFVKKFTGHLLRVNSLSVSNDGKFIVSGSDDMSIIQWDIKSGSVMNILNSVTAIDKVVISDDNTDLLSIGNGSIHLWDLNTGRNKFQFNENKDGIVTKNTAVFSNCGNFINLTTDNNLIKVYSR